MRGATLQMGGVAGFEELRADLEAQRQFFATSIAVYERLLATALEEPSVLQLLSEKLLSGRAFSASYERPLLLVAALRYAALRGGEAHPLYRALVSLAEPRAVTREALWEGLSDPVAVQALESRFVQTNELSRSVSWQWVTSMLLAAQPPARVSLFDIGASAGLNLVANALELQWSTRNGAVLAPRVPDGVIAARRGFDKNPLNALEAEDADWLLACVWPGQSERERRLAAALDAFRALAERGVAPSVSSASIEAVPQQLRFESTHAVAYQTIVRDYVPQPLYQSYENGMREWLTREAGRALWVELELAGAPGDEPERSTALRVSLCVNQQVESFTLARCHPHPQVMEVDVAQGEAFRRTLAKQHG